MRKKTIKIGQGKVLPSPLRLLFTIVAVGALVGLLLTADPDNLAVLLPMLILCSIVPAFWTSLKVTELHAEDHQVFRYWWVMGRKLRYRLIGQFNSIDIHQSPSAQYQSIILTMNDGSHLELIDSAGPERLKKLLTSMEQMGLSVNRK